MRICMVAYSFYESDMRIVRYARTLAARGDSVDVIALRREGTPAFEVLEGVNVYRVQSRKRNEKNQFHYLVRILRFLIVSGAIVTRKHVSRRYDVIHVHSVPDFLVFSALLPKLLGARLILDIHDILPEFFGSKFGAQPRSLVFRLLLVAEKLSVRTADHVIVANDLWKEKLVDRCARADRCTAILNYPDSRLFYPRDKSKKDAGRFIVLYPGTLNFHQGLDVAVRAFERIAKEAPDIDLHIYGEGPAKLALLQLAADLGLGTRVIFHEFVPCDEIAEIMSGADLAVVPKRASSPFGNEAISTKIMEFMALGVPVITSRTRVETFYHDERRIRFFESENEADLADAVLSLRRDPEQRERLTANSFSHVGKNDWQTKQRLYLDIVDGLYARSRDRAQVARTGRLSSSPADVS